MLKRRLFHNIKFFFTHLAFINRAAFAVAGGFNIFDEFFVMVNGRLFLFENISSATVAMIKTSARIVAGGFKIFNEFFIMTEGGCVLSVKLFFAYGAIESYLTVCFASRLILNSVFFLGDVSRSGKIFCILVSAGTGEPLAAVIYAIRFYQIVIFKSMLAVMIGAEDFID